MSATVRIDARAHEALSAIARAKRLSLTEALSRAIEAYRREVFVADLSSDFAVLREDEGAWAEESAERALWERASGDGLPPEPDRGPRRPRAGRAKMKSAVKRVGKKRR